MTELVTYDAKQLDLIRRTVAKDCNAAEFDLFIANCRALRLNPLTRQVYAFVFSKNNPEYRNMVIVTSIGGYRAIAERTGNYRPDEKAPRITYDDSLKGPLNPLGIVSAEVTVYKKVGADWFPVTAEAYWEEFCPTNREGTAVDPKKTGWVKMPRVMIAKVAEAQALRKAWPEDFAAVHEESEIDRSMIDITPSEAADAVATDAKLALIGGKDAITLDWGNGSPLARVPLAKFADAVLEHANSRDLTAMELRAFWHRNLPARGEFKAKAGSDYLELQREIEAITERKEQAETAQDAAE